VKWTDFFGVAFGVGFGVGMFGGFFCCLLWKGGEV